MSLGPLMVDIAGTDLDAEDLDVLAHPLIGSVILFSRNYRNPAQLEQLTARIQALRSPALLIAVDQEGGRVQRFREGFTRLPAVRRIGHLYDQDPEAGLTLARHHGWLMAAELISHGVDYSFAPCVDLDYGLSEVIGDRAFHARATVVSQLAIAYMHGMRDAGMSATAKHFPGHGAVVADSHLSLPVDRRELVDLDQDLMPYRRLIDNGLPAVMVAHVQFPAVDPRPASFSHRWVSGVLRGDMNFQGAVFADDLSMGGAAGFGDITARAEQALAAGCDVLPVCNDRAAVRKLLRELKRAPDAAAGLRQVRMRARRSGNRAALSASSEWRTCLQSIERCMATPELQL
jgi:beta-N-acetylhexosaminidase